MDTFIVLHGFLLLFCCSAINCQRVQLYEDFLGLESILGIDVYDEKENDGFESDSQTGQTCRINSTSSGRCTKLELCDEAIKGLSRDIIPVICSYNRFTPIVCCPPQVKPTSAITTTKSGSNNAGLKSKQMCKVYSEAVWERQRRGDGYVNVTRCGRPQMQLFVVGGSVTNPKEFPHMALIGFGERTSVFWMCGGSLISERFVLSAAHCAQDPNPRGRGVARWVRLGDLNLATTNEDARPQDFAIIQRIVHPEYRDPIKYNDIALFKLDRVVTFSAYVRPACLQTDFNIKKQKAIASGWGKTSENGRTSAELRKVDLSILSTKACQDTFDIRSTQNILPNGIREESMLCAGELKGGKDTCQGDSGGPLQVLSDEHYCMYNIIGIVSFGKGCAQPNSAGVYTRVSYFVSWIENIVWPNA